jgi:hypothetical protein
MRIGTQESNMNIPTRDLNEVREVNTEIRELSLAELEQIAGGMFSLAAGGGTLGEVINGIVINVVLKANRPVGGAGPAGGGGRGGAGPVPA